MPIKVAHGPVPETWVSPKPGGSQPRQPRRAPKKTTVQAQLGKMTAKQAAKWTKAQISYPNLAGDGAVVERALQWVRDARRQWIEQTRETRIKWAILNKLLKGNSLASMAGLDIIHTPELYKALEAMVPRIEERIFREYPHHFRVRANRKTLKREAELIAAFLVSQLSAANADRLIQPAIRSMLVYSVSAIKVAWERRFEKRIAREIERTVDETSVTYEMKRSEAEVLAFDGPMLRLVDPIHLIVDTRHTEVSEMDFIGDERDTDLGELRRGATLGLYMNVEQIQRKPGTQSDAEAESTDVKFSRNPDRAVGERFLKGGPTKSRVTELWGKFDLYGDGHEVESMVVVADDNTVLRVSENFLDDRGRPYALGRAAREEWEFYNTGPLDHCAGLNEALDRVRSVAFRTSLLSMTPIVFTENEDESVDSIFTAQPGSIVHGTKPIPINIQARISDLIEWSAIIRQDIEETAGAPRIFAGNDDSETATQAVANRAEANKRMASLVRSQAQMWRDAMKLCHQLNRQFVTADTKFRAVGRWARSLGHYPTVSPMTFTPEVDFEFVALDGIYHEQSRATAMTAWMNQMAPFMGDLAPHINLPGFARQTLEAAVGFRIEDEILNVPPLLSDLEPQAEENLRLLRGEEVEVRMDDPHEQHIEEMADLVRMFRAGELNQRQADVFLAHFGEHFHHLQNEANQEAARGAMAEPGPVEAGQVPAGATNPMSRQRGGQIDGGAGQTPTYETPGMGTPGQVSNPGRRPMAAQSENSR